ncbi:hypothetical protein HYFRA_00012817 [Hymenoscyphus fraxineus]|uniref:SprT-like domain-containing protein n=1 Tax=Hymenoscyphus fraxineus TaxID=746836 RepID=A0A9N9LB78_9HELO|nr:hypothetical protein HYFRA_00012817 [Hymenoscyphus fraxineus]
MTSLILYCYARGTALSQRGYFCADLASAIIEQNGTRLSQRLRGTDNLLFFQAGATPRAFTHRTRKKFVDSWARALDQAFFFGNLLQHITGIYFVDTGDAQGTWSDETWSIELHSTLYHTGSFWEKARAIQLITTLLHEMIHGFFGVFCTERALRLPSNLGGVGIEGHGRPWADAMASVQDALNQVLPFTLDGRIFQHVRASFLHHAWRPTAQEMRRWGATESEIRDMIPDSQPSRSRFRQPAISRPPISLCTVRQNPFSYIRLPNQPIVPNVPTLPVELPPPYPQITSSIRRPHTDGPLSTNLLRKDRLFSLCQPDDVLALKQLEPKIVPEETYSGHLKLAQLLVEQRKLDRTLFQQDNLQAKPSRF